MVAGADSVIGPNSTADGLDGRIVRGIADRC